MWRSLASASALGAEGRRFESYHPDLTNLVWLWPRPGFFMPCFLWHLRKRVYPLLFPCGKPHPTSPSPRLSHMPYLASWTNIVTWPSRQPDGGKYSATPKSATRIFGKDENIVSKTDNKGLITYANQTFIRISGFQEEDLLGALHNAIRHPDMPKWVFQLIWDTI